MEQDEIFDNGKVNLHSRWGGFELICLSESFLAQNCSQMTRRRSFGNTVKYY